MTNFLLNDIQFVELNESGSKKLMLIKGKYYNDLSLIENKPSYENISEFHFYRHLDFKNSNDKHTFYGKKNITIKNEDIYNVVEVFKNASNHIRKNLDTYYSSKELEKLILLRYNHPLKINEENSLELHTVIVIERKTKSVMEKITFINDKKYLIETSSEFIDFFKNKHGLITKECEYLYVDNVSFKE